VKNLLKKLKKIITGMDIEELMAIKNTFQGNKLQWIKTQDRSKMGKIVSVVEIEPGNRGKYIAQLSDGSRIDTDRLSSDLMMLMDDQPALSMAEIQSINYIPSLSDSNGIAPGIPDEFKNDLINAAKEKSPIPATTPAPIPTTLVDAGDLFGMFALEDTELALTVSIKLPSKNLLKMMYTNSQDKEQFLNRLSMYINNSVTTNSIKDSLVKSFGQDKKKKINATAIS
jgi:hypothetical protein